MDELEPLAGALRRELGEAPEAWKEAQRKRWREGLPGSVPRVNAARFAPWAVAAVLVAGALLWVTMSRQPPAEERWLVAEELSGPVRLEDGSTIALEARARGRLFADDTTVRFDLHQGRASFDVVPARKRSWTINAGKNAVRVVGTRFSVSYGSGEAFEVEVERGIVAVQVPDRTGSMELKAGDHLTGVPGRIELVHAAAGALQAASPLEHQVENTQAAPAPSLAPAVESASPPPSEPEATAAPLARPEWQVRYRSGQYAESVALIRAGGVAKHLTELSPSALADLADAARLGGDPGLAVRALTLLLQRFPSAPEARDGRFLRGRVHVLLGNAAAAIDDFESYLRDRPSARYASETRGRLMELYSTRGDTERAREFARQYLQAAPNGPYQRLARSLASPTR
jgi:TolA-binding protein